MRTQVMVLALVICAMLASVTIMTLVAVTVMAAPTMLTNPTLQVQEAPPAPTPQLETPVKFRPAGPSIHQPHNDPERKTGGCKSKQPKQL